MFSSTLALNNTNKPDSQLERLINKYNKGLFLTSDQKKKVEDYFNNKANSLDDFPELVSNNKKQIKQSVKDFNVVKENKIVEKKEDELKQDEIKVKKNIERKVLLTKNKKESVPLKKENLIENRKYTEVLKISDKSKLIKHKANLNSNLQMKNNYIKDIYTNSNLSYNNYNEWVANNNEFKKLDDLEQKNRNSFLTGNNNLNVDDEELVLTDDESTETNEEDYSSDYYSEYNSNYDDY